MTSAGRLIVADVIAELKSWKTPCVDRGRKGLHLR